MNELGEAQTQQIGRSPIPGHVGFARNRGAPIERSDYVRRFRIPFAVDGAWGQAFSRGAEENT
jgi:hypothetical protein